MWRRVHPHPHVHRLTKPVMGKTAGLWIVLAGLNGLIAVAAGAYGAHGLSDQADYLVESFNTGVDYHMWHALALLGVAWLADRTGGAAPVRLAGLLFMAGIIFFSGSLYVFGITADIPFAGSAPAGGLMLMGGWILVCISSFRLTRTTQ